MYPLQKNYNTRVGRITGQARIYLTPDAPEPKRKRSISKGTLFVLIICAVTVFSIIATAIFNAEAEEICWILCKPAGKVNIRRTPGKDGIVDGQFECGDWFETDGKRKNGFIHALNVTENGEGWIYAGFVVEDEPVRVEEYYVCVAKKQVACRRWVNGPKIKGRKSWLHNGTKLKVYYIAGEWAVTSRGYIMSEWLEAEPA